MRNSRVLAFDPDAMVAFQAKYDMHGFIHKGAYGQVWRCTERATGQEFACKVVQRTDGKDFFPAQLASLQNEAYILQKLLGNCEGVVRAHDTIVTSDSMHLVMELCEGGDLRQLISSKGPLSEDSARLLFRQLASSLQQLHSRHVVHRDIKPGNILLSRDATCLYSDATCLYSEPMADSPNNNNNNKAVWDGQARLGDFGMAAVLAPGGVASAAVGTQGYQAPELLRGIPYGAAVDIWSLGAVLAVMLTGRLPFPSDPSDALGHRVAVLRGRVDFTRACWAGVPEAARDLVRWMLRVDPKRRPTASELLTHPWCATHVPAATPVASASPAAPAYSSVLAPLAASGLKVALQGPVDSEAVLRSLRGDRRIQKEEAGSLGQEGAIQGESNKSCPQGKGPTRKLRWPQSWRWLSRN